MGGMIRGLLITPEAHDSNTGGPPGRARGTDYRADDAVAVWVRRLLHRQKTTLQQIHMDKRYKTKSCCAQAALSFYYKCPGAGFSTPRSVGRGLLIDHLVDRVPVFRFQADAPL